MRRRLRELLSRASIAGLGRRDLASLLRDIQSTAVEAYARIADQQGSALGELVAIEAGFAARAVDMERQASDAQIERAAAQLLVLGQQRRDNWRKQAGDLSFRIRAIVQNAALTRASDASVLVQVLGTVGTPLPLPAAVRLQVDARSRAPAMPVPGQGELGKAGRAARALIDAEVASAAHAGRMAEFAAAGVQAVRWHAILDPRVCPLCALHAGKQWDLKGFPIGHKMPLGKPPPAHFWCRCILLPMKYPPGVLVESGTQAETFRDWLARRSDADADKFLGKGRAELWRRGVITLPDLINQGGQLLALAELRRRM